MKKKSLVSIVIVTYNSQSYIEQCLRSVQKVKYPNFEVVIVDNHSQDQTVQMLGKSGSRVRVIKQGENLGFSAAVNLGVKQAKGELILVLNPDTTVKSDFLQPLVIALQSDQQAAVCQPAVFLRSRPDKLNLTGKVTHYLGFDWLRDYHQPLSRQSGPVDSFSGSAFMISKQLFEKVGGFDEQYFMYYEESDLAWRLRLLGYRFLFVPTSQVWHDYRFMPAENNLAAASKFFYAERNRLATVCKNYSLKSLLLIMPALIFFELGMMSFALSRGWLPAKLKSYASLWQMRIHLQAQRRLVQSSRVVPDKQIVAQFESKITFVHFSGLAIKYLANPVLAAYWWIIKTLI